MKKGSSNKTGGFFRMISQQIKENMAQVNVNALKFFAVTDLAPVEGNT